MEAAGMRRAFRVGLVQGLRVVWPILSGLMLVILLIGFAIGQIEGWSFGDSFYFAFVSGLTIGYGDLVPKSLMSRLLAIAIGFTGILLTGLVAAVGVHALQQALTRHRAR